MTVKQLIDKLMTLSQDATVIIENTDWFENGMYTITGVREYDNSKVEIFSDHETLVDEY